MEVADNSIGDAPVLPALLGQIPSDERIASISGDGAYDTKDCHEAIALRAADAHHPDPQERQALEEHLLRCTGTQRYLVRDTQTGTGDLKKWSGYHRRSLVETKRRCFKLLGERVMARDFDRQVAELQVRAAVLNRFTRLGAQLRSQCYKTNYKLRQLGLRWICSTKPMQERLTPSYPAAGQSRLHPSRRRSGIARRGAPLH